MIKFLIFVLLVILPTPVWAVTYNAADCVFSTVQAAINNSDATKVVIPAGSCAWNSNLQFPTTRAVWLQGMGATTVITGSGIIRPDAGSGLQHRISDFTHTCNMDAGGNGGSLYGQLRVDHMECTGSEIIIRMLTAIIDHNHWSTTSTVTPVNCAHIDGGDYSWTQPLNLGADSAGVGIYFEYNLVESTNYQACCAVVDTHGAGCRTIERNNFIINNNFGGHDALEDNSRGHVSRERYNNIQCFTSHVFVSHGDRGGTGLIANNITGMAASVADCKTLTWLITSGGTEPLFDQAPIAHASYRLGQTNGVTNSAWNKLGDGTAGKMCSARQAGGPPFYKQATTDADCPQGTAQSIDGDIGSGVAAGWPLRDQLGRAPGAFAPQPAQALVIVGNLMYLNLNGTAKNGITQTSMYLSGPGTTSERADSMTLGRDYVIDIGGVQTSTTSPFNGAAGRTGRGSTANMPTSCGTDSYYLDTTTGTVPTIANVGPNASVEGAIPGIIKGCSGGTFSATYWTAYTNPYVPSTGGGNATGIWGRWK